MGFFGFASAATTLQLVATTGPSGFALQNGTPTILSWAVPNDGNIHTIELNAVLVVSSAETGGLVVLSFVFAGSVAAATPTVFAGGSGVGSANSSVSGMRLVAPGTTVTLAQTSALTAGAAIAYAELWGI
jgi:hypothetical protein